MKKVARLTKFSDLEVCWPMAHMRLGRNTNIGVDAILMDTPRATKYV